MELTQTQIKQWGWRAVAALVVVFLVFPFITTSSFQLRLLMFAFMWTGFAIAWNILSGYSGYISFGHAVFFGTGAFTSTLLLVEYDISPWIGLILGGIAAAAVAVVIGSVTFRLSGIYFGLAMLSFPLILIPVITWIGYLEISIPFQPGRVGYMSYRGVEPYYYLALGLLLATAAVAWQVQRSRIGYYLRAIKGSEQAAESLGVNTFRYEIYALMISAFLSGLFGTVFAQASFILTPAGGYGLPSSVQPVVLSVAGGLGTFFGPIVGGMLLYPLAELLRSNFSHIIPGIDRIVYGVILIVTIIFLPDGIYPGIRKYVLGRASPDQPSETEETATATATEESDD
jgi:branched-chain amino acid transport system permease protein